MHHIGESYIKETLNNRIDFFKFKSKEKYFLKVSSLFFIGFQEKNSILKTEFEMVFSFKRLSVSHSIE